MRKRSKIMRVIWNINGVLFLILVLILSATVLFSILGSCIGRPAQSVKIVAEQTKKPKITDYQLADEPIIIKDCYIFEIQSDVIYRSKRTSGLVSSSHSYMLGDDEERSSVNLIFVTLNDIKKYPLFKKNALILQTEYANFGKHAEQYGTTCDKGVLDRNLYLVVSKDTNGNNQLDESDQRDFYVSDYNGRNLRCVAKHIDSYSLVDDNQVIIKIKNKGKKSFALYDIKKDVTKPLLNEHEINHLGL